MYIIVSYEKNDNGLWELMNTYCSSKAMYKEVITNMTNHDFILIINVIKF